MKKYIINSQEELNELNKKLICPEEIGLKWSGCNYYKNQGNHEHEPIGTAQSMHDCTGCEKIDICKVKKDTPIWFWNEDIEKQLNEIWKSMFN